MPGRPDSRAMLARPPPLMLKLIVLVCPVAALLCWMAQRSEPVLGSSLVLMTVKVLGTARSSSASNRGRKRRREEGVSRAEPVGEDMGAPGKSGSPNEGRLPTSYPQNWPVDCREKVADPIRISNG